MSTNTSKVLLPSAARTVTTTSELEHNPGCKGLHLIVDVTVVPGVDTVTPSIVGISPLDGSTYTILTGTALSATGKVILKVYPGITAVANGSAPDFLPERWQIIMTHSAASSFTYSVSANLNK